MREREKPSVHDLALRFVARQTGGRITHFMTELRNNSQFAGRVPDVITDDCIHEVEVLKIKHKIRGYAAILDKRKKLWVVFDGNPFLTFDEIRFLCHQNGKIYELKAETIPIALDIENKTIQEIREKFARMMGKFRKTKLEYLSKKKSLEREISRLKKEINSLTKLKSKLESVIKDSRIDAYIDFRNGNNLVSIKVDTEMAQRIIDRILSERENV